MADVHTLPESTAEGVVGALTRLLQRAIAGEITAIACAVVYEDGDAGWVVPANQSFYKLAGAVGGMQCAMHFERETNG